MPRGYRCILIAAVGCLILTGAAEGKHQHRQERPDVSQSREKPPAPAVVEPPVSSESRQPDQEQCVGTNDERETCTQASAQAAVEQARYAHWQAVAGAVGVLVGIGTLGAAVWAGNWAKAAARHTETGAEQARRGADEAARSADAAHAQSDLSLRNFETDNRAWLVVDSLVVDDFSISKMRDKDDEYDVFFVRCHIKFRNIGRSPAVRYDVTFTPVGPEYDNYMAFREQSFPVFTYAPMINCLAPGEARTKKDYRWRKVDDLIAKDQPWEPGIMPVPPEEQAVVPQVGVIIRYQAAFGGACETRQLWRIGSPDKDGIKNYIRGNLQPGLRVPAIAVLERTFIMT